MTLVLLKNRNFWSEKVIFLHSVSNANIAWRYITPRRVTSCDDKEKDLYFKCKFSWDQIKYARIF